MIKPIYKAGDKNQCTSYRPISILSTFSKVFEKIVLSRLTSFLENHKILSDNQYGFRKGKTTLNAMYQLISKAVLDIDNGKHTAALFVDICKAFDMVCHKRLLDKLETLGIRGISLNWFSSYLSKRRQSVT